MTDPRNKHTQHKRVEHWEDLGYVATLELGYNECFVELRVVKIFSKKDDGSLDYVKAGETACVPTDKIEDAEIFLSGDIKFDGCTNLDFNDSEVMVHFCGKKQAMELGTLLGRLYDVAREMMPQADWS